MYTVTYCCDLANHKYSFKLFETKKKALEWCKSHIGGLHLKDYEKMIRKVV